MWPELRVFFFWIVRSFYHTGYWFANCNTKKYVKVSPTRFQVIMSNPRKESVLRNHKYLNFCDNIRVIEQKVRWPWKKGWICLSGVFAKFMDSTKLIINQRFFLGKNLLLDFENTSVRSVVGWYKAPLKQS